MSRLNFTNIQKMIHSFSAVSFSTFKLSKQRTFEEAGSIVTKMPALALKVKAGVKETDFPDVNSNWIGMDKWHRNVYRTYTKNFGYLNCNFVIDVVDTFFSIHTHSFRLCFFGMSVVQVVFVSRVWWPSGMRMEVRVAWWSYLEATESIKICASEVPGFWNKKTRMRQ